MSIIEHLARRIAGWTRTCLGAGAAVRAIEDGRWPASQDMRRAGLDPWAFVGMGHSGVLVRGTYRRRGASGNARGALRNPSVVRCQQAVLKSAASWSCVRRTA